MKKIIVNQNGSALVITFAFVLFFFVIVNGLIANSINLKQSTQTENISLQMKYLLESAAVIAVEEVKRGNNGKSAITGLVESARYTITYAEESPMTLSCLISVEQSLSGNQYLRRATVQINKSTYLITAWN